MNNIKNAFNKKGALIGFLTAGDPTFEKSLENLTALAEAGADLIEIGIPFSDPIAEGVIGQAANIRALENGMTTDRAFELAKRLRERTSVPICFMSYLNPVFKYGYDKFFARCKETGIDGIVIPDLPFEEKAEAADAAKKYDVAVCSMLSPGSEKRIKMVSEASDGFLYLFFTEENSGDAAALTESVRKYTNTPTAISADITSTERAKELAAIADGVIISSKLVELVAENSDSAAERIAEYVRAVKQAIS